MSTLLLVLRRRRLLIAGGFVIYAFTAFSVVQQQQQQHGMSDALWWWTAVAPALISGNKNQSNDKTVDTSLFLVHIGKTGGSTVSSVLRIFCRARQPGPGRERCWDSYRDKHKLINSTNATRAVISESQLSQRTTGFLHVDWTFPSTQTLHEASAFVVTVRSPMDRLISWFYFMHPNNCHTDANGTAVPRSPDSLIDKACITRRRAAKNNSTFEFDFYRHCFPTVEDFAQQLPLHATLGNQDNEHKEESQDNNLHPDCPKLALEALSGRGGPNAMAGHLWANYGYYANQTTRRYPSKQVYVVRTQYLWHDLATIDQLVGGTGQLFRHLQAQHPSRVNFKQYHPSDDDPQQHGITNETLNSNDNNPYASQTPQRNVYQKDPLSAAGYQRLCCALQDEIGIYHELLQQARNLQPHNVQETMHEVWTKCSGVEQAAPFRVGSLQELAKRCESNKTLKA